MYYAVQALTFGILILAANTSYQGFLAPAAVLARDRAFRASSSISATGSSTRTESSCWRRSQAC